MLPIINPLKIKKFVSSIASICIVTFSGCTQRKQNENNSMDQVDQNNTYKEESMEGQNSEIKESIGSIKENTVSELEFVGWGSHKETESKNLQVTITIKNIGDEITDIFHYNYDLKLYDLDIKISLIFQHQKAVLEEQQ